MRRGRDAVAHLREGCRKERMMGVVRPSNSGEGLSGFGIFLGTIAGTSKMAPEALWVVRVEAHRLLDPVDALFRPSQPRQKLALLHDNQVVVGVEGEGPLLMIRGLVKVVARQIQRGEYPVHIAIIVIEGQRYLKLRGHRLEGGIAIGAPIINPRLA